MPSKPLKPCNVVSCPRLTTGKYCEEHQPVEEENKAARNKYYDENVRDSKATAFYKSREWKKMREYIFTRDNGLCQIHLKQHKEIISGDVVHHIKELLDGEEGWRLRLEPSNLITICHACHNRIHGSKVGRGYSVF